MSAPAGVQDELDVFLAVCDVLKPGPVHETEAILHSVLTDPLPSRQTDRQVIEAAVVRCAAAHRDEVHISWLRKYVDRNVMPEMWGAVIHARKGWLEPAGYHLPSMGDHGNARKLSPVWRYVGPTPITR